MFSCNVHVVSRWVQLVSFVCRMLNSVRIAIYRLQNSQFFSQNWFRGIEKSQRSVRASHARIVRADQRNFSVSPFQCCSPFSDFL